MLLYTNASFYNVGSVKEGIFNDCISIQPIRSNSLREGSLINRVSGVEGEAAVFAKTKF